jgi:hypothetical protein
MSTDFNHLLQPTISRQDVHRPMYSLTSHVIVAFFFGPWALLFYSFNSVRYLGKLRTMWFWYLPLFICVVILQLWFKHAFSHGILDFLGDNISSILRLCNRALALLLVGIVYLWQKRLFAISEFKGDSPSPWLPAIICGFAGFACTAIINK